MADAGKSFFETYEEMAKDLKELVVKLDKPLILTHQAAKGWKPGVLTSLSTPGTGKTNAMKAAIEKSAKTKKFAEHYGASDATIKFLDIETVDHGVTFHKMADLDFGEVEKKAVAHYLTSRTSTP